MSLTEINAVLPLIRATASATVHLGRIPSGAAMPYHLVKPVADGQGAEEYDTSNAIQLDTFAAWPSAAEELADALYRALAGERISHEELVGAFYERQSRNYLFRYENNSAYTQISEVYLVTASDREYAERRGGVH